MPLHPFDNGEMTVRDEALAPWPRTPGGLHEPLVIAGPGVKQGKSEALVYLMDLFTTFADIAQAKLPDGVEGRSLLPILEGKQAKVRNELYTGYRNCQRSIRDDRWKLIRYPLVDRTQLFRP